MNDIDWIFNWNTLYRDIKEYNWVTIHFVSIELQGKDACNINWALFLISLEKRPTSNVCINRYIVPPPPFIPNIIKSDLY